MGGKSSTVLFSGGNPQVPMAIGDGPVRHYIDAMPGWKADIGRQLDAVISQTVPNVEKAVKWNSPFYGIEQGRWFLSFRCFTKYVKVTFFDGASLVPAPPELFKAEGVRGLNIYQNDGIDLPQIADWIEQASVLPGKKL